MSDSNISLILYSNDFDILYLALGSDIPKVDQYISDAMYLIWSGVSLLLAFLRQKVYYILSICWKSHHSLINFLSNFSLILNGFANECVSISSFLFIRWRISSVDNLFVHFYSKIFESVLHRLSSIDLSSAITASWDLRLLSFMWIITAIKNWRKYRSFYLDACYSYIHTL